jgi:prepilin-type N-terminal cleavage/methylation domain-containing protein
MTRLRKGFTLIELLIAIAIVAILVTATVSLVNPLEQFKKVVMHKENKIYANFKLHWRLLMQTTISIPSYIIYLEELILGANHGCHTW